jgi:hypothetical protein
MDKAKHDKPHVPSHTDRQGQTADIATDFPAALEELNRAAVHVTDRLTLALSRSKALGATPTDLSKIKTLTKDLQNMLVDIDEIAGSEKKPVA